MADVDGQRLTAIYAEIIRDQWDPYKISKRNLPFLAWALGVNLWESWWSEEFSRYWAANQWQLKGERGSLPGLIKFTRAVNGEVKRVIRPPARAYALRADTDAERAAYVARFPQLRLYPYVDRERLPWLCYTHGHKFNSVAGQPFVNKVPVVADWTVAGGRLQLGYLSQFVELLEDSTTGPHDITLTTALAKAAAAKNYRVLLKVRHHFDSDDRSVRLRVTSGTNWCDVSVELHYGIILDSSAQGMTPTGALTYQEEDWWVIDLRLRSDTGSSLGVNVSLLQVDHADYTGDGASGIDIASLYIGDYLYGRNGAFLGPLRKLYPTIQNQGGNYTRTSVLWDRGISTTLTVRRVVRVQTGQDAGWGFTPGVSAYDEEVVLPLKERLCFLEDESDKKVERYLSAGRKYGIYPNASPKLRTISIARSGNLELTQGKAQYQTISATALGVELLRLEPEIVATRHQIRLTELYQSRGQYLYKKFLPHSNAWRYLYERWYIFDADRVPDYRRKGIYMGHARFGIPKYTAEALIKISAKAPRFIANCSGYIYGYFRERNDEPINSLRRGVRAPMALRDTVLIDTAVTRRLQVRDIINLSGRVSVGQWVTN
jgi:hypothetical protein